MSSAAYFKFAEGTGPSDEAWEAFCDEHLITFSPNTVGGKTFYCGGVEITRDIDDKGEGGISFSTFFMGPEMAEVAGLTLKAWQRFGGTLELCDEIRSFIAVVRPEDGQRISPAQIAATFDPTAFRDPRDGGLIDKQDRLERQDFALQGARRVAQLIGHREPCPPPVPVPVAPVGQPETMRPIAEYHEDFGPVLWWTNPVTEPPYVGSPLDLGRTIRVVVDGNEMTCNVGGWPGYHKFWTPLPVRPMAPKRVRKRSGRE